MAELFNLGNLGVADSSTNDTWSAGNTKLTGDLRRKYNFGSRVSELSIAQDPFFRFVSKVGKKPTDDPTFKFTEKRGSWYKRYGYVVAHAATSAVGTTNSTITAPADDTTWYLKMETDYYNDGNKGNTLGQSGSEVVVGATGTQPQFYLEDQIIKVNLADAVPSTGAISAFKPFSAKLNSKMAIIKKEVHETFKPKWVDDRLIIPKFNKDGSLSKVPNILLPVKE